jgi:hypothetical protein
MKRETEEKKNEQKRWGKKAVYEWLQRPELLSSYRLSRLP